MLLDDLELDLDDPEEPVLEGSDDEFSDLQWSDDEVDLTTAAQAETQPQQAETQPPQAETQPPQAQTQPPQAQTQPPQAQTAHSGSLTNNSQSPPVKKPLEWSNKLHNITINPFTSAVGPTVTTIPQTPLGIFRLFFSSDLVETIVEESNR